MDERILNSNLFSKMIYDEATKSDSHFNHFSGFLLPNEMGGSQTRLVLDHWLTRQRNDVEILSD